MAISLGHTENGEPLFANFTFEDWALLSREALGEKSLGFPGHVVVVEASDSSCTSSPATSIESPFAASSRQVHSFRRDANDEERLGIHETHLSGDP